jgi:hypothetical protein
MSSALPKKAQDRVNTYGIVLIGLVSALLLWVSVVALQAYYNRTSGLLQGARDAEGKNRQVIDLKSAQVAELNDSKVVNPQKQIVTIPIGDAEKLVLQGLREGAPSLVPAIGPHDLPTVPAVWGKPADVKPAEGAAPAGAAPAGAAPAGAAPAGGADAASLPPGTTPGTTPTPRDPNTPRSEPSAPAAGQSPPAAPPAASPSPNKPGNP